MSKNVKLLHWYQVYKAYTFCRESCPAALESMSRRLTQDMELIKSGYRVEGLSDGSGLESVGALRQLDAMIDSMEAGEFDMDPMTVPDDSMESGAATHIDEHVATRNAESARAILLQESALDEEVRVIILKFARSPERFKRALLESPELRECRDSLQAAGLPVVLEGSAAKVFVRPGHYTTVMEAIRQNGPRRLFASHVIVAEEYEGLVQAALSSLRSSDRVTARGRTELPTTWDDVSEVMSVRIDRTFITVRVPMGSLLSYPVRRGTQSA
jgi:hypothetical protein